MTADAGLAVVIDVSAIPMEPRGAGRYVVELVRALDARGHVALRLLSRRGDEQRWEGWAPSATVTGAVPRGRAPRLAWEQLRAAQLVNRLSVDVYHGPHYTMPAAVRVPRVVTVHDLTFFDHPEYHERRKVAFFRRAIRLAAEHADAVVCVSDATRRRLEEIVAPRAPVHVVTHGIDHDRFTPTPAAADDVLRQAVGAVGPYVLFLGTMEPRKNVGGLVAAFDVLATSRPELRLVLAGGQGWGDGGLRAAVNDSPHVDRIAVTGYVSDEAVPALLRGAAAVVYPAFVEGFGLPVLEALACGTPVVTTSGSVMDEIAEGAALTAPAGDVEALSAAMEEALTGGGDAVARRRRGLEVASRYTWSASAAGHERVYASVSAGRL